MFEVRRGEIVIVFGFVGFGVIEVLYMAVGHMLHMGVVCATGMAGFVLVDCHVEGFLL